MDFFGGSSTTAQSVIELNEEDGGSRSYIIIQVDEACDPNSDAYLQGCRTICDIGIKRMKKIHSKHDSTDSGFRVFKCDSSNMKKAFYSPEDTKRMTLDDYVDNVKSDRTPEDLLFQVMLECFGLDLSCKINVENIDKNTIFTVNNGFLVACFDESLSEDVVISIAKRDTKPAYVVFRDSSMRDDMLSNVEQIFRTYSPNTTVKIL